MARFSRIVLILALLAMMAVGLSTITSAQTEVGPITQAVMDRGELNCAVHGSLAGFGFVNDAGEYEGFDVDLCRAVAAAILGDATKVVFRPTIASERQAVIQSGEVDMMVRNTTWTLSRDVTWGAIFGPTTFFDGQGVGTWASMNVSSISDLDGTTMCVQTGTTTELNITDYIVSHNLDIQLAVFPDTASTWEAFLNGACESWTTDKSGIAAQHSQAPNPGDLVILPETISKEPLGPLSPQSDPQFAEIIAWTVYGMIDAEEAGITSQNIDDFMNSDDPNVQRILGLNNNPSGDYLGIDNSFMVNVIKQVGNYGEVYDRNLAPIGLTREGTLNALWENGGILYAPPFR